MSSNTASKHSQGTSPAVSTAVCTPSARSICRSSAAASACNRGSPPESVTPPPEIWNRLAVAQCDVGDLRCFQTLPCQLQSPRRATLRAFAAGKAFRAVELRRPRCPRCAKANAGAAADALRGVKEYLRFHVLRLGIVAPGAAKPTTLEKDCRARSRSVVEREALYIKDGRLAHISQTSFLRPDAKCVIMDRKCRSTVFRAGGYILWSNSMM